MEIKKCKNNGFLREVSILHEESVDRQLVSRIEIITNSKGYQELYVVTGDQKVCLNDFIPKELAFWGKLGGSFCFRENDDNSPPTRRIVQREISFPIEEIDTVYGRLALIHETGHGLRSFKPDFVMTHGIVYQLALLVISEIKESDQFNKIETPEARNKFLVQEFKKRYEEEAVVKLNFPIKYKIFLRELESMVIEERGAWAEALNMYRRIKEESGVDILDGLSSDEIFSEINSKFLGKYEETFGLFLKDKSVINVVKDFIRRLLMN